MQERKTKDDPIIQVNTSNAAFAALSKQGRVYVWGNRDYGGLITAEMQKKIDGYFDQGDKIAELKDTDDGFIIRTTKGKVFILGFTYYDADVGGFSLDDMKSISEKLKKKGVRHKLIKTPTDFIIQFPSGEQNSYPRRIEKIDSVKDIAAKLNSPVIIYTIDDKPVALGFNQDTIKRIYSNPSGFVLLSKEGLLYRSDNRLTSAEGQKDKIIDVFPNDYAFLALTQSGNILTFGDINGCLSKEVNFCGLLPPSTHIWHPQFTAIKTLLKEIKNGKEKVEKVIPGYLNFSVITEKGNLYSWGYGSNILVTPERTINNRNISGAFIPKQFKLESDDKFISVFTPTSNFSRIIKPKHQNLAKTDFIAKTQQGKIIAGGLITHHNLYKNEYDDMFDKIKKGDAIKSIQPMLNGFTLLTEQGYVYSYDFEGVALHVPKQHLNCQAKNGSRCKIEHLKVNDRGAAALTVGNKIIAWGGNHADELNAIIQLSKELDPSNADSYAPKTKSTIP
jgi:hypothetical protein